MTTPNLPQTSNPQFNMNQLASTQELMYAVSDLNFVAPYFPQYEFCRLLAQGTMGASYKAIQTKLDREVAMKVIARRIGRGQTFAEAFATQARESGKLNHPNLVKVYDFGAADEMLFMVNEYVSGTTLDKAANGCAVDPEQVLKIMIGLSDGMDHAHNAGVVHGDLQPSTVLVNASIEPKINDFGLAMSLRTQGDIMTSPLNPHFTAPEIYYNQTQGDELTDIYSLGAIMYFLLTAIPYAADVPEVSSVSTCDERFDAVVRKALHEDRMSRYGSVSELLADLKKIQSEDEESVAPFVASPTVLRSQTVRVVKRDQTPDFGNGIQVDRSASKFNFPIAG